MHAYFANNMTPNLKLMASDAEGFHIPAGLPEASSWGYPVDSFVYILIKTK